MKTDRFAALIAELRKRARLTQQDLATQLGVSIPTVNRWERGKATPDRLALQALVDFTRRLDDSHADLLRALEGEDVEIPPPSEPTGGRPRGRKKGAKPAAQDEAPAYGANGHVMDTKAMENLLWKAACSIRGEKDAPKFKDYILPLLFAKRLSDVFEDEIARLTHQFGSEKTAREVLEADHTVVRFYIPELATWPALSGRRPYTKWPKGKEPKTLGEHVTTAMRAIANANETLKGVIDIVDFNEVRNGVREISDEALKKIIELFSDPRYRLGLKDVTPDFLGDCYEYLLRKFAEGQGQSAGEFFTPREVGWLMAQILNPQEGESAYDPCCGSASLLVKCELTLTRRLANEKKKLGKPLRLHGQELNGASFGIARMNTVIHDMDAEILRGDSMRNPKFTEDSKLKQFDIVVTNPMWNQNIFDPEKDYDSDPFGRFEERGGYAPQSTADWAWLQHVEASLNAKGRAAVVMDTGAASRGSGSQQENKEKKIRQWFVERDLVEAVILLPENLFYNTTAAGLIFVLNKDKPKDRKNKVLMINASGEFEKGRPKNYLTDSGIRKIADACHAGKNAERFAQNVKLEDIRGKDFNLSPSAYVVTTTITEQRDLQTLLIELSGLNEEAKRLEGELGNIFSGLGYRSGDST